MTNVRTTDWHTGTAGEAALTWLALLAPPVVWSSYFLVSYFIASAACGAGTAGMRVLLAIATVVALTIIVLTGVVSLAGWRQRASGDDMGHGSEQRPAFMLQWGVLASIMFFIATSFTAAPMFVLHGCG
jgi:hypothetical protein